MNKIFSAIISSPLKGRLGGVLFALLATTNLWAQSFQSGDLWYSITSNSTVEVTRDNYSNLTTVTIPETVTNDGTTYTVTSIGDYAFATCSSLTSITIPNSVTSIGDWAFEGCSSLTSVTIPNSVTSIGGSAFRDCSSLTSITIPKSVKSIGTCVFGGCNSLVSIAVEEGNTIYDSRESCNAIVETATNTLIAACKVTIIPSTVMAINGAFRYTDLISIYIPSSVTNIGYAAFESCDSLISVNIPNSVANIDDFAFWGCSSLPSITIPSSVTNIGLAAFYFCHSLSAITIPDGVKTIGNLAFAFCDSLESITIANSVTKIEANPFVGTKFYNNVSNWEDSVLYIDNCLIKAKESILNCVIKTDTRLIVEQAFVGCSSVATITIPKSMTNIGDKAFADCSSLTTMTCEAVEVPELGLKVFNGLPLAEAILYVPAESLDDYKAADQWKDFGTILPIEEEEPEEEIKLQDTDMTIVFTNSEDSDSEIYRETITIKVPTAPTIAGFTFLYWQPVAEPITNEITIQAIYEADTPTSAEVYVNPANPTQKLLRNGQVYILQDGKTYTITGQKL